jgi:hypothetical protein
MPSISYQRKAGHWFLPELLVILSYHLGLGLPGFVILLAFPLKLYPFILSLMRVTRTDVILLDSIILIIVGEDYKFEAVTDLYLTPCRPTYFS